MKTASVPALAATAMRSAAIAMAIGMCALAPAYAQSKIAWLSTERIYNESRMARAAGDRLAEEFRSRERAVQDLAARLKGAAEKLEKELPSLAEPERIKRQREYFELDKEFQRRQREFREDLNQRTNEERAMISDRATQIIKQLAATEGYDIVLQDAVWASPRIDITDKVLAALDKGK